jgi:hypothetical protein
MNSETMRTARQQILNKEQLNNNSEEQCFLSSPWQDVITSRGWSNIAVVEYSLDSISVSTEAEESPLFRSITREQLVKAD